jgi:hypothetical protein
MTHREIREVGEKQSQGDRGVQEKEKGLIRCFLPDLLISLLSLFFLPDLLHLPVITFLLPDLSISL